MGMIAEKLIVLWPILLREGHKSTSPCSFHNVLQAAAYRVNASEGKIKLYLNELQCLWCLPTEDCIYKLVTNSLYFH